MALPEETQHTDYLVIGSGIAGLTAAREFAKYGNVLVATKGPLRESNTHYAQGGIAVAMEPSDTPARHLEDTLMAGDGLCDPDHVKILVEEGPARVSELIQLGANFDREEGELHYTREGAHQTRRILHAGDATGREIEKTLGRSLLGNKNVRFFPYASAVDLLVEDGHCSGAMIVSEGRMIRVLAKATLLATGGAGQVYERNTNPPTATGDGVSLAYEKGVPVQDMEFVQFHPTTLFQGDQKPISIFLISEAVRGEGAHLRNEKGERFMPTYHDLAELAPRDVVSRAILSEIFAQDSPHVYLDLSHLELDIPKRFPTIFERCMQAKIDLRKDLVPVVPAAHYCIGGLKTDEHGATSISGLYAAGEVAATGIHGANRLASNSLLEGLVFGFRAARHAQAHAEDPALVESGLKLVAQLSPDHRSQLMQFRHRLRGEMWERVGILRSEDGLNQAKGEISDLREQLLSLPLHVDTLELGHMLRNAELIVDAALKRRESRGAHYRLDAPSRDDQAWSSHLVWSQES